MIARTRSQARQTVMREKVAWNYLAAFFFLMLAVVFTFGFKTNGAAAGH